LIASQAPQHCSCDRGGLPLKPLHIYSIYLGSCNRLPESRACWKYGARAASALRGVDRIGELGRLVTPTKLCAKPIGFSFVVCFMYDTRILCYHGDAGLRTLDPFPSTSATTPFFEVIKRAHIVRRGEHMHCNRSRSYTYPHKLINTVKTC
jgi:hypothetical protein